MSFEISSERSNEVATIKREREKSHAVAMQKDFTPLEEETVSALCVIKTGREPSPPEGVVKSTTPQLEHRNGHLGRENR